MSIKLATRAQTAKARISNEKTKFFPGDYTIHTPDECQQKLKNKSIHLKRSIYDGKEVILVNGTRKLIVPGKEPLAYPKIITSKDFSNLIDRCHVPTKEEKEAALVAAEREKERLLRESMTRKELVRRMDLKRTKERHGRLNEIEEETRRRTMHLLERANKLKLEQEDEIKMCNKIILETKCRAIRDAQLAEKRLLEHEYVEEEKRLNELMERERVNGLKEEEKKEKARIERSLHFSKILHDQIRANEQERMLEFERKREESKLANLNFVAQQEAEMERIKEREAEMEKTRIELKECNERLIHFKHMQKEEDLAMEMRIQQYHREKAEREARLTEETKQDYLRKERGKELIAEQAMQAKGMQEQIDELNATKIQEEVEREWRKKEKAEALKRLEGLKKLRESREEQINLKMKRQAMEIERERLEFEKIVNLQREAACREEKEREKKQRMALAHRSEILKQVNEKERERIVSRQKLFEEGIAIRAENQQRAQRIRNLVEAKFAELETNNLPTSYINEVKRIIKHINH